MGTVMKQNTPSYDIGFTTGTKYAEQTASHMLSSNRVSAAAHAHYVQASRAITVDQAAFEKGWQDGYQAYFDGII